MKTFTANNIMDLKPCEEYSHERVAALFAGREALTLAQVLGLDIPAEDRIWVATRLFPPREAHLFACDCAEHVLPLFERKFPAEDRLRRAIDISRRFARGEATLAELEAAQKDAAYAVRSARFAAEAGAYDAAYWAASAAWAAAAFRAAGAAAGAAYWSAADAGAYDAAYWAASAAGAAAGNAADAAGAAGAAEREWQVERLRVYAKELETA